MSSGRFVRSRYESDGGEIYSIRLQPETIAAVFDGTANAAPTGAVTTEISAQVSRGKRSIGMNARTANVRFTSDPPTGYAEGQVYRIPILTPDLYNELTTDTIGSYLSVPIEVVGLSPERRR